MDNEIIPAPHGAAIVPFSDIERMAKAFVASKMFGMATIEQAVALMLIAQAEGIHPAAAARDYHIIQNRPALKADTMLARFQAAGGVVEWEEVSDTRVAGLFSHPRSCPKPVLIDWDMQRAKRAGLGNKDMWSKYPRQMLRARVISEGVRTAFPGVLSGLYAPEEVMDFEPSEPASSAFLPAAEAALAGTPNAVSPKRIAAEMADVANMTQKAATRAQQPVAALNPPADTDMPFQLVHLHSGKVKQTGPKARVPGQDYICWQAEDISGNSFVVNCFADHVAKAQQVTGLDHPEQFDGEIEAVLENGKQLGNATHYMLIHFRAIGIEPPQIQPADDLQPPDWTVADVPPLSPGA